MTNFGLLKGFKNSDKPDDIPITLDTLEREYCAAVNQPYPITDMVFARSWMLFRVSHPSLPRLFLGLLLNLSSSLSLVKVWQLDMLGGKRVRKAPIFRSTSFPSSDSWPRSFWRMKGTRLSTLKPGRKCKQPKKEKKGKFFFSFSFFWAIGVGGLQLIYYFENEKKKKLWNLCYRIRCKLHRHYLILLNSIELE